MPLEYIQNIMQMEESVQHVVMNAIQEVDLISKSDFIQHKLKWQYMMWKIIKISWLVTLADGV